MLKFKNVHIGRKETLFKISDLNLEKGKLYGLIGKNGIGKSTFLNTIMGNTIPLKGIVEIENNLPREKQIALVSSKFEGVEFLKTREYIALGRAPYTNFIGKLTTKDIEIVDNIIQLLDIEHIADCETTNLSDGERQIASIGRALAQQTEVILLDEPLAFLDYENKIKILELLGNICKQESKCIIHSSHDIELCLKYTNEILIIDNSKKELIQANQNVTLEKIVSLAFQKVNL
jgi:iron complex transport system ATP-binding protein